MHGFFIFFLPQGMKFQYFPTLGYGILTFSCFSVLGFGAFRSQGVGFVHLPISECGFLLTFSNLKVWALTFSDARSINYGIWAFSDPMVWDFHMFKLRGTGF